MLWTKFINFLNNNNTLNAIKIIRINENKKLASNDDTHWAYTRAVEVLNELM